MFRSALFVSTFMLSANIAAEQSSRDFIQEVLATGKMAGACGIIQLQIQFQANTNMPGGADFVERFVSTEAARLGKSSDEYMNNCAMSISTYSRMWELSETVD